MKKSQFSLIALGILTVFVAVGCNGTDSTMTKEQENAMRHPVADPNYKGPDPASQAKMQDAIAAFNAKHKNDKVEFKSGN